MRTKFFRINTLKRRYRPENIQTKTELKDEKHFQGTFHILSFFLSISGEPILMGGKWE